MKKEWSIGNVPTDFFRYLERLLIFDIRQKDHELFTAVTGDGPGNADQFHEMVRKSLQDFIPSLMPIRIIDGLEMIQVKHDKGEASALAALQIIEFQCEKIFEVTVIVKVCEGTSFAIVLGHFVMTRIFHGHAEIRAENIHDHELHFFICLFLRRRKKQDPPHFLIPHDGDAQDALHVFRHVTLGNILPFFLGREEHGFAAVPHPTAEALPFLQRGQIIRHAPAIFHPSDQNEIRVIAIEDVRILDRECRSDFLDEDIQYFGHLQPLCELVSDLSCFLQVKVDLLR